MGLDLLLRRGLGVVLLVLFGLVLFFVVAGGVGGSAFLYRLEGGGVS